MRWILITVVLLGLSPFFFLIQKDWDTTVKILCAFYAVATVLFFVAQLVGFILSQTQYSDAVEAPKFEMLDNEEAQWK